MGLTPCQPGAQFSTERQLGLHTEALAGRGYGVGAGWCPRNDQVWMPKPTRGSRCGSAAFLRRAATPTGQARHDRLRAAHHHPRLELLYYGQRRLRLRAPARKQTTRSVAGYGARVEHAFARMKHYTIHRDCRRQRGDGLQHAVQAVAHLRNPALTAWQAHAHNSAGKNVITGDERVLASPVCLN